MIFDLFQQNKKSLLELNRIQKALLYIHRTISVFSEFELT